MRRTDGDRLEHRPGPGAEPGAPSENSVANRCRDALLGRAERLGDEEGVTGRSPVELFRIQSRRLSERLHCTRG